MESSKHFITEEILNLVRQAIADTRGSKAAFSRQTGITPYNLSKLLNGRKKFVFGDDWNKLCDFFPEIHKNKVSVKKISGNNNITGNNNFFGEQSNRNEIEDFKNRLIGTLIDADLQPDVLKTVLSIVKNQA